MRISVVPRMGDWRLFLGRGASLLAGLAWFSAVAAGRPLSCSDPVEGHWAYGPGHVVESWAGNGENLLLVGNGAVLTLIDATHPAALDRLGEVSVSDPVRSIAVSADGNLAAFSDWRSTIRLVDIGNRSAPMLRGSLVLAAGLQPYGMELAGNRLYVAIRNVGMGVVDITDPDSLSMLGMTAAAGTGFVFDLKLRGNYAYLADDDEGVSIVDISNPSAPVYAGRFAGSTLASRIHVEGSRAYVARRGAGFDILDLSIPTLPTLIGSHDTPAIAHVVKPRGASQLVVADGYGGTVVYDIANPAAPVTLGSDPVNVYGLAMLGTNTFVLPDLEFNSRLRSIDFSHPLVSQELDSLEFFALSAEVRIAGDRILVANGERGLGILDLSDPGHPVYAGGFQSGSTHASDVEWINGHAVVGSYGQLEMVDIADPARTRLISTITVPDVLLDLDSKGNLLFATWGFSGLKIHDLTNPASPVELGTFQLAADGAIRVAVHGNLAVVSGQSGRVFIVDISNPAMPRQLSEIQFASFINDLAMEATMIYVATAQEGVRIVDVSIPAAPVEVAHIPTSPAVPNAIAVRNDRLYVAAGEYGGLRTYDVGVPGKPRFIGERQTSGEALWVDVDNDILAISEGPTGVRTLTCTDDSVFGDGFAPPL